jgi:hypothetical protein
MQNKNKIIKLFRTKDLVESLLLYSCDQVLDAQEWENGDCTFVFLDEAECLEVINKHYKGELNLNSKAFINAYITIKGILRR